MASKKARVCRSFLLGAMVFFSAVSGAWAATITVTTTADEYGTGSGCSVREAIQAANTDSAFGGCPAGSGADTIILPAGVYTLSLANLGGVNEDNNATGDLDILSSLTIQGAGAASTIIQAGTDTTNGIDKVFAVNPFCSNGVNVTTDGVTIRYGRNTQAWGAADYSFTGGGIDWCGGSGTDSFTLSNAVVSDNTNIHGYGGGLNVDSLNGYTGAVTITNVTFQNNRTSGTASQATGGGLNIFGDRPNVIISNSKFMNNATANPDSQNGAGGGVYIRPSYGGSVGIHNSLFSGNVAGGMGGGIFAQLYSSSTVVTIDQGSQILNNVSGGVSGGEAGGGGIAIDGALTSTPILISKSTITGNSESGASGTRAGGGGIYVNNGKVTVEYSRIANNTVLSTNGGSGLYKNTGSGAVTATNNWWGCSSGPSAAPCDTAVIAAVSSGSLASLPYLQLRTSAPSPTVEVGQSTSVTASFASNSAGADVSANMDRLIGLPVTWSATGGSLSGQQPTIQANGSATATYLATAVGSGQAAAVVDNDTTTAPRSNVAVLAVADTTPPTVSAFTVSSPTNNTLSMPIAAFIASDNATVAGYLITTSATPPSAGDAGWSGTAPTTYTVGSAGIYTLYPWAKDPSGNVSGVFASPATVATYAVIYAVPGGLTNGFCGSWASACELSHALDNAVNGQEIWVKAGTYQPTSDTDRTATFQLRSGVALYGGFAGEETDRSQRNIAVNQTILSGDIGTQGDNSDNSYHVVTGANSAVLDGFTVSGGNANGSNPFDRGGGMYNNAVSLIVSNCTFSGNHASFFGGGMFNYLNSSPALSNCTFSGNSAAIGAGMSNHSYCSPTVTNCTFSGNAASNGGGGMHNIASTPIVTNCTFSGNTAPLFAGGGIFNSDGSNATIRNSIFWNVIGGEIQGRGGSTASVSYSVVFNGYSGTGNINADPRLAPLGNYGGAVQTFALLPGSSAIDEGDPATCVATDQRGITRPHGSACDIGAFESRGFALAKTVGDNQSTTIGSSFANPLTLTVTSAFGDPVDGGKITFTPPGSGAGASITGSSAIIAGGSASVAATANGTVGGPYLVTASATGANSIDFSLTNNPIGTATGLVSSRNPGVFGQPVTFTATVSPVPTGGTVAFNDNGTVISGCGTQALTAGQATCSTSVLVLGTHAITAEYSGTATYGNSMGTVAPDQEIMCFTAITVANNADSGIGSLRQAIAEVCAGGTIGFDPALSGQTITLTGGQLAIGKSLTIDGLTTSPGISVSGNNAVRAFYVSAGAVTINNLTISNGRNVPVIPGNIGGAGLFVTNPGTTVTLNNCAVLNNATSGITTGGGIVVDTGASLIMNNCTVSGNSSTFDGGGILNLGTLAINNSTIVGNSAPGAGGGLETVTSAVTMRNTILAGNSGPSGPDCYTPVGTIQSAGYNMVGSTSNCSVSSATGDVIGFSYASLLLGALQNNGGPTSTYALSAGSPAINAIPGCNGGQAIDQRGVSRPQGAVCDVGAYEAVWPATPTATAASAITAAGFTANWNVAAGASGYYLDVATDSGFTSLVGGYNNKDVGNTTSAVVSGLAPGTTYHYRVQAYNGIGSSAKSGTIGVTTQSGRVSGIIVDPSVPSRLYCTVDGGGVFSSIDGGGTWAATSGQPASNRLQAIILQPGDPAKLFVASYGSGVYVSPTSGASWSACASGGLTGSALNILTLALDATGRLYAGTEGGIFTSTDCGTWTSIKGDLPTDASKPPVAIVIDPTLPSVLYAGLDGGGVYKTSNGGTNWIAASQPADLRVKALARSTAGALFAATYGGGVFKSENSGDIWNLCPTQPANLNVTSLTIDAGGRLYAGTEAGVFVSGDGCATWTAINGGLP